MCAWAAGAAPVLGVEHMREPRLARAQGGDGAAGGCVPKRGPSATVKDAAASARAVWKPHAEAKGGNGAISVSRSRLMTVWSIGVLAPHGGRRHVLCSAGCPAPRCLPGLHTMTQKSEKHEST